MYNLQIKKGAPEKGWTGPTGNREKDGKGEGGEEGTWGKSKERTANLSTECSSFCSQAVISKTVSAVAVL